MVSRVHCVRVQALVVLISPDVRSVLQSNARHAVRSEVRGKQGLDRPILLGDFLQGHGRSSRRRLQDKTPLRCPRSATVVQYLRVDRIPLLLKFLLLSNLLLVVSYHESFLVVNFALHVALEVQSVP